MLVLTCLNEKISISKEIENKSFNEAFEIISEYNSEIINNAPIGANIRRDYLCSFYDKETGYKHQLDVAVIVDGNDKEGVASYTEKYVKAGENRLWYTGKNRGRRGCAGHYNRPGVFFAIKEEDYNKNWNSIPV